MTAENRSLASLLRGGGLAPDAQTDFGAFLTDCGLITLEQLFTARSETRHNRASLNDCILAHGWVDPLILVEAQAAFLRTGRADLAENPPDPELVALADPKHCLRYGALPWRREAGETLIATARPELFTEFEALLPDSLRPARPMLALETEVQGLIADAWRDEMTINASARVPAAESCRTWERSLHMRVPAVLTVLLVLAALLSWQPRLIFGGLVAWACFTLVVAAVQKGMALLAYLLSPAAQPESPPMVRRKRPVVSILVPLFKEREVATVLVQRLERITYPKALLDVILVLEENDSVTRDALDGATLPPWMRVIVAPDGQPRTKPRAMNYALDFCRGEIIGIYDAEDAPEPDQIDRVADRFRSAPDDLVCLQGVLDYYNPRQNWLARCFTVEYATWFRVMMPGMARLGFAIPLGGTTLFFRRDALEQLGGWDAHNVTEDADLGFRLARHGYRTEMLVTTTHEEANCHFWPWIKQRSRWLKGYMVTYLVQMRSPFRLFRELGPWKFIGVQTHFITAISQFLLAPLLWSFWLILLGFSHPLQGLAPPELLLATARLFLGVEVLTIIAGLIAVSRDGHRHLLFWVPTLHFYYPLGTIAAYKALYELIFAPFYWDKTTHGLSLKHKRNVSSASL